VAFHIPPSILPVTTVQVLDLSLCNVSYSVSLPAIWYDAISKFVLGIALLALATTQTLKQLVGMYKATKQWQPNRYMQQLTRDGILYFLAYVSPFPAP